MAALLRIAILGFFLLTVCRADDTLDEDEFAINTEPIPTPAPKAERTIDEVPVEERAAAQPAATDISQSFVERFVAEIALIIGLLIYVANYFYGSYANKQIATKFAESNILAMRAAFGHVGDKAGNELICESCNEYVVYGTGRKLTRSLTLNLELLRRQDLVGMVYNAVMQDQDALHVHLDIQLPSPQPLVLTLCRADAVRDMKANNADCGFFTSRVDSKRINLPGTLTLLAENPEAAEGFISKAFVEHLTTMKDVINAVHISDQWYNVNMREAPSITSEEEAVMPKPRQVVSINMKFDANNKQHLDQLSHAVEFSLALVECLKGFRLTASMKAKADKKRKAYREVYAKAIRDYETQAKRQEAQDRKIQQAKKAAEKGDEALAKWEEKQNKRQRRKQAKSGSKMMVRA